MKVVPLPDSRNVVMVRYFIDLWVASAIAVPCLY